MNMKQFKKLSTEEQSKLWVRGKGEGSFWSLLKEFREVVVEFEEWEKARKAPENLDEFRKLWGCESSDDDDEDGSPILPIPDGPALVKAKLANPEFYADIEKRDIVKNSIRERLKKEKEDKEILRKEKQKAKQKQYYKNSQEKNNKEKLSKKEKEKKNKNYVGNFTLFKEYISTTREEDDREYKRQYQWFYREYNLGRRPTECPPRMLGQMK